MPAREPALKPAAQLFGIGKAMLLQMARGARDAPVRAQAAVVEEHSAEGGAGIGDRVASRRVVLIDGRATAPPPAREVC